MGRFAGALGEVVIKGGGNKLNSNTTAGGPSEGDVLCAAAEGAAEGSLPRPALHCGEGGFPAL